MTEQDWWDWYWRLVALADEQLVVIAPGTIERFPVTAWISCPLTPGSVVCATSPDDQVRVGQILGALYEFRRVCASRFGMAPLQPAGR